jgi:hypothetical protein
MTCDIANVYTFGVENPLTPSAGASFGAELLLPSAFNRDALKPSASCGRRRAPMFAPQGSPYRGAVLSRRSAAVRDLGLGVAADGGNTSQDPTPSASASYTPEQVLEPDEFNKQLPKPVNGGRRDGKAVYRGIAPRKHQRGHLTRSSPAEQYGVVAPLQSIIPAVSPSQPTDVVQQQGKPSLEDISDAAGQLATVAADSVLKDKLDEIKSQALALAVKRQATPNQFVPGMPLERSWQLLADSVMEAAEEIGAADPAALQATLAAPAERSRLVTKEDISSLKVALESDMPRNEDEVLNLLANAATWLSNQANKGGSNIGSITLAALDKIYASFKNKPLVNSKTTRKEAFPEFEDAFYTLPENEQVEVAVALGRAAKGGINFMRSSGP